ncbi:nuclear transport factor 2 family protein [Algoriphagus sp. Y33]|uniref:nuclear transport factor 2 family protein n=1 Tax=Algoriphagus sp. Y33 TaxID=2772483 RepID=UPI001CE0C3BE|nr:nuclear transport factor 2 family protein [Algoriphagus sp. Y33]
MAFLQEFKTACVKEDLEFLTESVTDEIVWNIVGDKKAEGKGNFIHELKKRTSANVDELVIDQVLSHGKGGAINGKITGKNGKSVAFAEFFIFNGAKGAKIKSITTYLVEL